MFPGTTTCPRNTASPTSATVSSSALAAWCSKAQQRCQLQTAGGKSQSMISFTFYFQTNPDWLLVAVCDCDGDHLLRKPRCFPDLPHHRVPHLRPQHPRGEGWWWRKIFPPILGLLGGEQGGHLGSPWWICHWKLLWGCRGREIQVHFRNSPVLKTGFFITMSMRFCSGILRSRLWSTKRRTPFQAGRWPKIFCHCQLQVNLPHDQEQRACVHWVEVQVGAGHEGAIQHHQTVWLCLRLVPHILHWERTCVKKKELTRSLFCNTVFLSVFQILTKLLQPGKISSLKELH